MKTKACERREKRLLLNQKRRQLNSMRDLENIKKPKVYLTGYSLSPCRPK